MKIKEQNKQLKKLIENILMINTTNLSTAEFKAMRDDFIEKYYIL